VSLLSSQQSALGRPQKISPFARGVERVAALHVGDQGIFEEGHTPKGQVCRAIVWSNGGEHVRGWVIVENGTQTGRDGSIHPYSESYFFTAEADRPERSLTYAHHAIELTAPNGVISRELMTFDFGAAGNFEATNLKSIFIGERTYGFWVSGATCLLNRKGP
jgi:hypothetical protein